MAVILRFWNIYGKIKKHTKEKRMIMSLYSKNYFAFFDNKGQVSTKK